MAGTTDDEAEGDLEAAHTVKLTVYSSILLK
jgi:hypothetical protein